MIELRQQAIRQRRERLARRRRARDRAGRKPREVPWPRRSSDAEIATALALVAQGKTLRDAGAAHPTVLRWLKNAA